MSAPTAKLAKTVSSNPSAGSTVSGLGKIRADFEQKKEVKVKELIHLGGLLGKAKTLPEMNGIKGQMAKLNIEIEQLKLEADTKLQTYTKAHTPEVKRASKELDKAQKDLRGAGTEYQQAKKTYDQVLKAGTGDREKAKAKAKAALDVASSKVTTGFKTIGEIQRKKGAGFVKELASSTLLTAEAGPRYADKQGFISDRAYSPTDRQERMDIQREIQDIYDARATTGKVEQAKIPREKKPIVEYRKAVAEFHKHRTAADFKAANGQYQIVTTKFNALTTRQKSWVFGHLVSGGTPARQVVPVGRRAVATRATENAKASGLAPVAPPAAAASVAVASPSPAPTLPIVDLAKAKSKTAPVNEVVKVAQPFEREVMQQISTASKKLLDLQHEDQGLFAVVSRADRKVKMDALREQIKKLEQKLSI